MENMRADIRVSRIKLPGFFKGSIKCHIRNGHRNLFGPFTGVATVLTKFRMRRSFFFHHVNKPAFSF